MARQVVGLPSSSLFPSSVKIEWNITSSVPCQVDEREDVNIINNAQEAYRPPIDTLTLFAGSWILCEKIFDKRERRKGEGERETLGH